MVPATMRIRRRCKRGTGGNDQLHPRDLMSISTPIVRRYEHNPILTPADIPYPVVTVHNAGITLHDGRVIMLFRSHRRNGRSVLGLAESTDGYAFTVRKEPFMVPASEGVFAEYEAFAIEDARICAFEDGWYLITYSAYSKYGVRIGLARTRDFQSVERVAFISECDMRNVVIFPEKIGGRYVRLDRPQTQIDPWSIWISYSDDLIHWGESRVLIRPVHYHWDELKVGPGATPIRTEKGWLNIFHGVVTTMSGTVYRLGVALHDLNDPARVLGVSDDFILEPEDRWERVGYVPNVVFTCGALEQSDGTVRIYWGGADTVMCAGEARIDELVELCLEHSRAPLG